MITELKGYAKATHSAFTRVTALISALALLCAGTAFAASPPYFVDIYDGFEITRVKTTVEDARSIVRQADIELGEQDKLELCDFEPGRNSVITVYRAASVSFTDLEGKVTYLVLAGRVSDLLKLLSVTLNEKVLISHAPDTVLKSGMEIRLLRAYHIFVTADGGTTELYMGDGAVSDALSKAGISLGADDELFPAADSPLAEEMKIRVCRVRYASRTLTEPVAYPKKTEKSDKLFVGEKKVRQKGVAGERKVTYRDRLVDGVLESSVETDSITLTGAVPEIMIIGTKPKPVPVKLKRGGAPISELKAPASLVIRNGAPENYSRIIRGKASAYYAPAGSGTASGRKVKAGHIAVNPKQIPYGTEMWIVSTDGVVYGYAIAADTGGFVRRGKFTVDLFMNTYDECCQWGSRNVIIYIL